MSRAATSATAPSRRDTSSSPTAAAPAITEWSDGKDQSLVRSTSTSADGCAAYGRASATRDATGWFTATASSVPAPAQIAAASRRSPAPRLSQRPSRSSAAKSTTPYFAKPVAGAGRQGAGLARWCARGERGGVGGGGGRT